LITYHPDIIQGSDEWMAQRLGRLTASEMRHILTPTLKVANNDKSRAHVWEIAAQRISKFVEPSYVSDDMLRGQEDEFYARQTYAENFAQVEQCGFVTNDRWGFTIGCSPDGLVGPDGLIECKSRRQKYQVQTIVEHLTGGTIPDDYVMQCQTALLVTEREWLDFISYSGGLPMCVVRVWPDDAVQGAIIEAAAAFEAQVADKIRIYREASADLVPTERRIEQEMYV
jgi:YqaJ-like viral recombinase domain